jgi:hypothetical protein
MTPDAGRSAGIGRWFFEEFTMDLVWLALLIGFFWTGDRLIAACEKLRS